MARLSEEEIEKIKDLYQHGKGSIQDYARIYRVEVSEILEILGMGEMNQVQYTPDLVDASEMGPEKNKINGEGEIATVPYTVN